MPPKSSRHRPSPTSHMGPHGRCTIPAEVRRRLGYKPGTRVIWEVIDGHTIVMREAGTTPTVQAAYAMRPAPPDQSPIQAARQRALHLFTGEGAP